MADEIIVIEAKNLQEFKSCLNFVEQLINNTQNINVVTSDGETPLHIAVKYGHLQIVDSLLKYNANVNAQISNPTDNLELETNLDTPLHLALRYGHKEIFDLLLNNNADPNIENILGHTSLHLAAEGNLLYYVLSLLNYNVNVNARCAQNNTALHYAVRSQSLEICGLLLDSGAYADAKNINEETPLTLAIKLFGEVQFVDNLLNLYSMKNYKFQFDDSVLKTAILCKCLYFVSALLRKGANLLSNNENSEPSLFTAIKVGSFEIVEILLKYLKHGNLKFKNKNTPLHVAAMFGHARLVRYFISLKFNVNAKNIHGETPLHLAAWCSSERQYNLLNANEQITISKTWEKFTDCKCTTKDCHSCSTFCICCENFCLTNSLRQNHFKNSDNENINTNPYDEVVDILLDNQTKVNFRTKDGLLPIHVAADRDENFSIVEKLLKAKVYLNGRDKMNHTPLYIAACNNCPKVVEVLLKYSVNINYQYDENSDTILHKTCENGNMHITHLLIKKTNDISTRNTLGDTSLHLAIQNQYFALTKMLILYKKNVQPNFENKMGQTPFDMLLNNYKNYDVNILAKFINILIKNGASPDRRNKNGQTILHIAVEKRIHSKNFDDIAQVVNVNIQDNNGFTALHLAVQSQDLYSSSYNIQGSIEGNVSNFIESRNYLIYLLREGTNINIQDNNNKTALELFYKFIIKNEKQENINHMLPLIKIFLQHIKKLQIVGYYISQINLEYYKLLENFLFKHKCNILIDSMNVFEKNLVKEINVMKEMSFRQNLKIFDILFMDCNKLAGSNFNELIQEKSFLSKLLIQEFPLSFDLLNLQFKRALIRNIKKQNARFPLQCLIKKQLPINSYEEIFKYLSNEDLNNIKETLTIYIPEIISKNKVKNNHSSNINNNNNVIVEPETKRQKIEQ